MLQYYQKHTIHEEFQAVRTPGEDGWLHVGHPTADELHELVEQYSLDGNIVRDVLDHGELPRSEFSGGNLYVFLRQAERSRHSGEVFTSPLLIVLTSSMFMTIAPSPQATDQMIMTAHKNLGNGIRTANRPEMLLLTMKAVIAQYEELIKHTGNYVKDVRRKLRNHEVSNGDFVHFVTIEDNLNEYQMNLQNILGVTERLRTDDHSIFSHRTLEELDDVRLYIRQLLSSVTSHSQSVTSIRNAYSTIANNTLNQRMKALTMLTVLIALPNVFYGMYGMNVPLPFQDSPLAYACIVLFTFVLIFSVYGLAKRFRVF